MKVDGASAARFWAKVARTDGCWLWTGATDRHGYGRVTINGRGSLLAHRVAWALYTGRWPELNVLHHCDVPGCVRHDHLFEGTQTINMRDAQTKGRTRGTFEPKKECKHGHEFTPENTGYIESTRHQKRLRYCRECNRRRTKEYREGHIS